MGFLSKASHKTQANNNDALATINGMPLQAKLRYGKAGDTYEQEADRVADSVVNNSKSQKNTASSPALGTGISNSVQKTSDEKNTSEINKEEPVQKKENIKEEKPVQKKSTDKQDETQKIQKKEDKQEEKTVQKKDKKEEQSVQKKEANKQEEKPVQKKSAGEEKDKAVQKKENKKEEQPVQKKEANKQEEKPVQKKSAGEEKDKTVQKKENKKEEQPVEKKEADENKIQKKESDNPKAEEPEIERQILASKNSGKPMDDDVRKEMEHQFGKDFTHVIIHNDALSYELCRKINALAFTHGSHVYFAEGKYDPQTTDGKHLLAHELTHVVQQGNELRRMMVQKTQTPATGQTAPVNESTDPNEFKRTGLGRVKKNTAGQLTEFELDHLNVPGLKQPFSPTAGELLPARTGEDRPTDQVSVWESNISLQSGASDRLNGKLRSAISSYSRLNQLLNGRQIYFLKKKGSRDEGDITKGIIMGNANDVLQKMKRPQWNKDGRPIPFDVDHKRELQLGEVSNLHQVSNMWLLSSFQNQASGRNIKDSLRDQINEVRSAAMPAVGSLPDAQQTRRTVPIKLTNGSRTDPNMQPRTGAIKYEKQEIEQGDQIDGLEYLNEQQIIDKNLVGSASNLAIYSSQSGGNKIDVNFNPAQSGTPMSVHKTFGNLEINSVTYNGQNAANTTNITLFKGFTRHLKRPVNFTADLIASDSVAYGGVLSKQSILAQLRNNQIDLKYASPIQINNLELTDFGVEARGKLLPSIPVFQRADIDVLINEDGITLSKTFESGEISVPSPLQISNASLSIFLSSERGFGIQGQVDFKINNVGEGFIRGRVSTSNAVELQGEFNFDSKLFDPAKVRVNYHDEQWTVEGQIGIPKGKIRGIKRGGITLTYANQVLTASGDVEPDIKGIQRGSMNALFSADGFLISGEFTLSNEIPGIRGGQVSASIEKTGDEYNVKAHGTAQPAIPGIDATLTIDYDNGALKIEGSATYQRGLLTGQIHIGATNRAIGADGQPAGNPTDYFIVYGGGELTVRITPWLQGTVGVNFLSNGEMEVSGRIGIPAPIDVFARKEIPERDIFSIGIDIPIFAIPLGPRSIGLKATIAGALKVYAGIGPGRLEQLSLGITYNPDHPETTHVTGNGRFVVPADAGLKLAVRASIGIDAGVAGVEGGIEVAGGLGLQATAAADVSIDWTPASGLELNANLSADVQPKLTFDIDGFVHAWVLFWDKEWRWRFAHREFGSNLNFGVSLPIHYKEGEAFNISFEDIQFRKPDIDATSVIGGLIRSLSHGDDDD